MNFFTALDGDTMDVSWQVMVSGNLDNTDCDYQANTPSRLVQLGNGHQPGEMTENEMDHVVVFNLKEIEKGVADGDVEMLNGVPVIDGRKEHNKKYTRYIPIPNSPHGCNTAPDGIHVVINGKLSPTCSVIDVRKLDALFESDIDPRSCIVAEPQLGLGPLHTAFDGKGMAYTRCSSTARW